jgi:poly-gamma-glutamate capsule biosynthesis protein CapA/YwtB (metallophosphatase superfamily)
MINWGTDYVAAPGRRQLDLREALREAAVSLILGVHPHIPARGLDLLGGGEALSVHSLGNFIFDQDARVAASGAILEVRVFDQGTYFARLVSHRNLFQSALDGEPPSR